MLESRLATKMKAVSASDRILAGQINDALQANKYLRRVGSDGIEIIVKEGVVTLHGHVGTTANKTDIDSAVHGVPGVVRFENQLVADDKLTMAVAQSLGNDDRMHGEQMGVNAQQGFIYLTGRASNATIRLLAAQIAADVSEVRGIINRIQAPGVVVDDMEEEVIQPAINQTIYTVRKELGRVRQVIIHPRSRRVNAVVVGNHVVDQHVVNADPQHGQVVHEGQIQQERHHLIPIGNLRCAPSGALFLKRRDEERVNFADFHTQNFIPPPMDWQPPYPYGPGDVLFYR